MMLMVLVMTETGFGNLNVNTEYSLWFDRFLILFKTNIHDRCSCGIHTLNQNLPCSWSFLWQHLQHIWDRNEVEEILAILRLVYQDQMYSDNYIN